MWKVEAEPKPEHTLSAHLGESARRAWECLRALPENRATVLLVTLSLIVRVYGSDLKMSGK